MKIQIYKSAFNIVSEKMHLILKKFKKITHTVYILIKETASVNDKKGYH